MWSAACFRAFDRGQITSRNAPNIARQFDALLSPQRPGAGRKPALESDPKTGASI